MPVGGGRVSPAVLEEALRKHPALASVPVAASDAMALATPHRETVVGLAVGASLARSPGGSLGR